MKKINIEINQAKILSYQVDLDEKYPNVCATIGLFAGEKKISEFSLRTQEYYGNSLKFELPIALLDPIKEIAKKLEEILTIEASKELKQLK